MQQHLEEFRQFGKNFDGGAQGHLEDFTSYCFIFRSCGVTQIRSTKEAGEFSVFDCEIANKVKD